MVFYYSELKKGYSLTLLNRNEEYSTQKGEIQ